MDAIPQLRNPRSWRFEHLHQIRFGTAVDYHMIVLKGDFGGSRDHDTLDARIHCLEAKFDPSLEYVGVAREKLGNEIKC